MLSSKMACKPVPLTTSTQIAKDLLLQDCKKNRQKLYASYTEERKK